MRTKLIAGNWKMHGSTASVSELAAGIVDALDPDNPAEVLVLPPFVYLPQVRSRLAESGIGLGAQDLSEHESGAYTGEISGPMLADLGCRYVLAGHSERRSLHHESDTQVGAKFEAAQAAGLTPILCLGETLEEREGGRTDEVVLRQLDAVIQRAGIEAFGDAVIAYEPVWAIGTGRTATPEQAQEVHALIRQHLEKQNATIAGRVRILYGGSVKPDNAARLFSRQDIDGGLIGGASLDAGAFMEVYRAALL